MYKINLIPLITLLMMTSYQNVYAHGAGGGSRSYTFEKNDNIAEQEAKHKAAEEKQAQESWGDFISAIKIQIKEKHPAKKSPASSSIE